MSYFSVFCACLDYTDENQLIPRNSSVIVKRLPIALVRSSYHQQQASRRQQMMEQQHQGTSSSPAKNYSSASSAMQLDDEASRINNMIKESDTHWDANQDMPTQYFSQSFYNLKLFNLGKCFLLIFIGCN